MAIMKYLTAAFEKMCDESQEGIGYLDAAMGVHNMHKAILFDLVDRTEMPPNEARVFLTAMRHTWDEAIDREIAKRSH